MNSEAAAEKLKELKEAITELKKNAKHELDGLIKQVEKEAKKKSVLLRAAAEDGILHSGGPLTLAAPALHRTAPRGHAECICDRAESSSARVRVARLETSELAHFFMSSRGCRPPSCSSMGITVAAQLSTMW